MIDSWHNVRALSAAASSEAHRLGGRAGYERWYLLDRVARAMAVRLIDDGRRMPPVAPEDDGEEYPANVLRV